MGRTEHPMTSGWLAGTIEITVTYPLEFIKTQLQLQQQVSNT
jgi:solute carrier family 25 citrate transporter 1